MGAPLSTFSDVTITRNTRTASRRGFNVAMLVGYHAAYLDRVRTYSQPSELVADGISQKSKLYLDAVALKAQTPSPATFKVGRRAGAPDQSINFTPGTPVEGEVFTLTLGGIAFSYTAENGDAVGDVLDALVALVNEDVDAIIATGASTTGIQTLTSGSFDGATGAETMSPARNVTITFNAHADWDATTIVVTGTYNGRTITDSFSVPNGGDDQVVGIRVFDAITQVVVPAQSGTNGTFTVGYGTLFENADLDIAATDNATDMDVATNVSGDYFSVAATANIAIDDQTPEPAITLATDLAAIEAADANWYGLAVCDAMSAAQIAAVATVVESSATPRLYAAQSADSDVEEDVETDIAQVLVDADRLRTKVFYSRANHGASGAAALLGRMFGAYSPGEASIEYKGLSGLVADDLSTTVLTRLAGLPTSPADSKRCTVYVSATPAGVNVGTPITWGGLTAGGEWFDVMQGIDYTIALLQEVSLNTQLANPRIPFTERGIARFKAAVEAVLAKVAAAPFNILDPDSIVVTATALADTSVSDRQARYYNGIRWGARVQGAIRFLTIGGTVTP
jgi:hypothetical protein